MSFAYTKILKVSESSLTQPLRTQMADGYIAQVKRYTNQYNLVTLDILLTLAQADSFRSWYKTNQANWFTLPDLVTGTNKQYRIVGDFQMKEFQSYRHFVLTINCETLV